MNDINNNASAPTVPLVSVLMITYDHEAYIREAVESVVMQQADFEYELVVGEDCSTDKTRAILLELEGEYPDKLRLLLHESNVGPHKNLELVMQACRGQYIAILEGDDYWSDPDKLAKQVAVFEADDDCAICFHRVTVLNEGHTDKCENAAGFMQELPPAEVTTFDDLLGGNYISTPSVMFRAGLIRDLPAWYSDIVTGDWSLYLLLARHGNIHFIDEEMAVYRRHEKGRWSPSDKVVALKIKSEAAGVICHKMGLNRHEKKRLRRAKNLGDRRIAALSLNRDDFSTARQTLLKLIRECPLSIFHPDVLLMLIVVVLKKRAGHRLIQGAMTVNNKLGRFGCSCKRNGC